MFADIRRRMIRVDGSRGAISVRQSRLPRQGSRIAANGMSLQQERRGAAKTGDIAFMRRQEARRLPGQHRLAELRLDNGREAAPCRCDITGDQYDLWRQGSGHHAKASANVLSLGRQRSHGMRISFLSEGEQFMEGQTSRLLLRLVVVA